MPRKIPEDIEAWIAGLRREDMGSLENEEKRTLADILHHPLMTKAFATVVSKMDGRREMLDSLNLLMPGEAAEAVKLQGEKRAVTAVFEILWEMVDAVEE